MRFVSPLPSPAPSPSAPRWTSGIASLDRALAGGFARGCIHEVYAGEIGDAAAAAGFAMSLAAGMGGRTRGMLWLRSRRAVRLGGMVQANGWAEIGGMPGAGLVGHVPDSMALLRAALDALRCATLGAVMVEGWGPMRELDLTASRRLALAAGKSGVPLLLLRIDAAPVPSAARTRWQVAAAPSAGLSGHAPGLPCFDVTLLRQRSGPCGLDWRLEWDRDRCQFRETPLPGAVAPLPADRPAAPGSTSERHGSERHGSERQAA